MKKFLSKGQKEMLVSFIPSAATFGFAALLALTYLSDWRLLTNYIPIYNTKYPKQQQKK